MFKAIFSSSLLLALCACSSGVGSINSGASTPVAVRSQSFGECANEVAAVSLTSRGANSRFNTEFVAPGAFKHQFRVITIDTTGVASGTLKINGRLGTGAAQGSFALTPASPNYVCSGFLQGDVGRAANVQAGQSFEISHNFSSGQVFRLLMEGSWDAPEKSTNTVDLTFVVN